MLTQKELQGQVVNYNDQLHMSSSPVGLFKVGLGETDFKKLIASCVCYRHTTFGFPRQDLICLTLGYWKGQFQLIDAACKKTDMRVGIQKWSSVTVAINGVN